MSSIFFNLFLETKFPIQLSLRQFFFEVNRINIRGDIPKKPYTSHHVFSHTQIQKFTGQFFQFHIPLRGTKIFKKSKKKVDAHRNVQVKSYGLRFAGGDFFSLVHT